MTLTACERRRKFFVGDRVPASVGRPFMLGAVLVWKQHSGKKKGV